MVMGRIFQFYEKELKEKASIDDNLIFFNVGDLHLDGKPHPVIGGVKTTTEAKEIRPLIKMLLNDYFTFEKRSIFSGGSLSPHCKLLECQSSGNSVENIEHILTKCRSTTKVRENMLINFYDAIKVSKPNLNLNLFSENTKLLVQYILDPLSQNLQSEIRISSKDVNLGNILRASRQLVNSIHHERLRLLRIQQK